MIKKKTKLYNVKSLKDQAKLVLSGKEVSKHALNIMCAEYVWQDKLSDWKDSSRLKHDFRVSTSNYPEYWFYIPDYSKEREQLEVRCVDSSHLLTRTRRKVCKGGIEHMTNEPWFKVARTKKTLITPIMIEDIVDPMSVPMAVTHFCSDVENTMRDNGDMNAASFCHAVRSWWKAEDESGISALDRTHMRIALRERLLDNVNFGCFPPPTMYIKGWPLQLWEALVASIDNKAILYSLAKRGTYNVRALSSMMGEPFFAEVTNQDKGGTKGTLTAAEFSHFIGKSLEQMHIRLDTERTFTYRTSTSSVYNLVENDYVDETYVGDELHTIQQSKDVIRVIKPRDHFFDTKARTRASGKQRLGTVSLRRNAVQKGTLGVRWEKARVNESKLLPTRKMGIPNE